MEKTIIFLFNEYFQTLNSYNDKFDEFLSIHESALKRCSNHYQNILMEFSNYLTDQTNNFQETKSYYGKVKLCTNVNYCINELNNHLRFFNVFLGNLDYLEERLNALEKELIIELFTFDKIVDSNLKKYWQAYAEGLELEILQGYLDYLETYYHLGVKEPIINVYESNDEFLTQELFYIIETFTNFSELKELNNELRLCRSYE